jgi:hypothetical protein
MKRNPSKSRSTKPDEGGTYALTGMNDIGRREEAGRLGVRMGRVERHWVRETFEGHGL